MAEQSRNQLKSYFQTGDIPKEEECAHLIDSGINKKDDDIKVDNETKNVGIGVSDPDEKLVVGGGLKIGDTEDGAQTGTLRFHNGDLQGRTAQGWKSLTLSPLEDGFWKNNGDKIYYNQGNVGVGTSSPDAKLEVNDGSILFSGNEGGTPVEGFGGRMMWVPEKRAFRAGEITEFNNDGKQWDDENLGIRSFAVGENTKASGYNSVAIGCRSTATATTSISIGDYCESTGNGAIALGGNVKAQGIYSFVVGQYSEAIGNNSVAIGHFSKAILGTAIGGGTAEGGVAIGGAKTTTQGIAIGGGGTEVNGLFSTAIGNGQNGAETQGHSSLAIGNGVEANGNNSIAIGNNIKSEGFGSFTIGSGQDINNKLVNNNINSLMVGFNSNLPTLLVQASNGIGTTGNVGIGTNSPSSKLDVLGSINIDINSAYQIGGDDVFRLHNNSNIFIGIGAGINSNNNISSNTFLGKNAGYFNTSGNGNTFLGISTGYKNTTGYNNTLVGNLAGYNNTTGLVNVFLGSGAGRNNTSGNGNTFLGSVAGYNNTLGEFNTFLGYESGHNTTTGKKNTFLGQNAGYFNTTGYSNTFIGCKSGVPINQPNLTNATAVGYNALVTKSNCLKLGNSNVTVGIGAAEVDLNYKLFVGGSAYTTGLWQGSDERYKQNIQRITRPMEKLHALRGASYQYKKEEHEDKNFEEGTHFGFVAQELKEVFPELVRQNEDGFYAINYDGIIPVLVEGIRELSKKVEQLEKKKRRLW